MADKIEPSARFEYVGRALAKEYAKRNIEPEVGVRGTNRRSTPFKIKKDAEQMLAGEWVQTNQGIGFDINGDMIDGGHRIKSLLLATETKPDLVIPLLVVRGLPSRAKAVIDIGRRRTTADFMVMNGTASAHLSSAAIRLGLSYDFGLETFSEWSRAEYTPRQYLDYINDPENFFLNEAIRVAGLMRKYSPVKATTSAAALFLTERVWGYETAFTFFEQVSLAVNIHRESPAMILRNVALAAKGDGGGKRSTYQGFEELALWIKAFNKFVVDEPMQALAWRTGNAGAVRSNGRLVGAEKFPRVKPKK